MTRAKVFRNRMAVATLFVLGWGFVILARLTELQVVKASELSNRSTLNHRYQQAIPAKRGDIVDCRGRLLAISQVQPSVCADPSVIQDAGGVARDIGAILGKDKKWVRTIKQRLSDKERSFAYVARWVSPVEWQKIKELGHRGIFCQKEPIRKYPMDWLGSHIVGFTSLDGSL